MDAGLFAQQQAAIREGVAAHMGLDGSVFLGERLTLVARPEPPPWPYFMFGATFGVGTAAAIPGDYLEWALANQPEKHFVAVRAEFAFKLLREGELRGDSLHASTGGLGWALSGVPAEQPLPPGVRIERISKEEMEVLRPAGVFHNGIGSVDGNDARTMRNNFGIAARNETGDVLAVAGVFDTSTMKEIGVDVTNAARGSGLARAVVSAAARAILDLGQVPFYACADTNIRSQRTALASGFIPVCSTTSVMRG